MDQENIKQETSNIPELSIIELGNGVFDKPGVLGDLVTTYGSGRVIIACENSNDIRFVESILVRRGLEIRRVSPIIDSSSIKSVTTWFEGKNEGVIVCHLTVAESISKSIPVQMVILYNPVFTEGLSELYKVKKESGQHTPIIALVSPQELPAFLISSKSYNKEFTSFEVKKDLVTKKTLDLINSKLSRAKISSQMPIQDVVTNIKNSEASTEIISKLVSFFIENMSSSNSSSIDEDLGLTTVKSEKYIEEKNQDREEQTSSRSQSHRNSPRDSSRDSSHNRGSSSYDEPNESRYSNNVIRYRTYFGAGELDELNVPNLRALLYDYLPDTARINRVHIRNNYSFVDIDSSDIESLIQCTENISLRGRLINTDIAEILGPVDEDRNGRGRNNNRRGGGRNYNNNNRRNSRGYGDRNNRNRDGNRDGNRNQRNNRRQESSY